jgi:hypothetical protein
MNPPHGGGNQSFDTCRGILRLLEKTLSVENSAPFLDPVKPLWRVIVLDALSAEPMAQPSWSLAVLFVYHHVIADGKSGLAFHNTLLHWLNHAKPGDSRVDGPTQLPAQELLPSMDELVAYRISWKAWALTRIHLLTPCLRKGARLKKWAGAPHQISSTKTHVRLVHLSQAATRLISQKCRQHGVSVTALLQVLAGVVLFETFQDAELLECGTAISLRRFFPENRGITDEKMGLWIDGFGDTFTRDELFGRSGPNDDELWKHAKGSKRHIDAEIRKGTTDLGFASLRRHSADHFRKQMGLLVGRSRSRSYSIISLGVFEKQHPRSSREYAPSAPWRLEQMVISQSAHVNGSAIQFCSVATEAGGITVSLNWQEVVVSEQDVSSVVLMLQEKLGQLGTEQLVAGQ